MNYYHALLIQESLLDTDRFYENFENKDIELYYVKKHLSHPESMETTPERFHASLMKSKHAKMLTLYSPEELAQMDLYKVPGYDIGFALKHVPDLQGTEIVAVHNNSPLKGIGDDLIKSAVQAGGRYLDHYDGFLSELYGRNGFEEYQRYDFDPQYDPDQSFAKTYGERPVIYRHHKSVPSPLVQRGEMTKESYRKLGIIL